MNPTEVLMEEHDVIQGVLDSLGAAAGRAEQGRNVTPGFFIAAADFFKGFADGCHHRKEENVLFPAMAESGVPTRGGPIEVMLAEHEQGRQLIRSLRAAADAWEAGDPSARRTVVESARSYIRLLRGHINKENNVLFPMAERTLPPEKQAQVAEAFEHVEHEETGEGVHERYLGLAEELEHEIAG